MLVLVSSVSRNLVNPKKLYKLNFILFKTFFFNNYTKGGKRTPITFKKRSFFALMGAFT